jgi:hypothetical protein
MEQSMRSTHKFLLGYIPYTLVAVAILYSLISSSRSWAAVLAGGIIFIAWSIALLLCQLVILYLPWMGTKLRFHIACGLVTVANFFIAPLLVMSLAWVFGLLARLAT